MAFLMRSGDIILLAENSFVQELQIFAVLGRLGVQFLRLWHEF